MRALAAMTARHDTTFLAPVTLRPIVRIWHTGWPQRQHTGIDLHTLKALKLNGDIS